MVFVIVVVVVVVVVESIYIKWAGKTELLKIDMIETLYCVLNLSVSLLFKKPTYIDFTLVIDMLAFISSFDFLHHQKLLCLVEVCCDQFYFFNRYCLA